MSHITNMFHVLIKDEETDEQCITVFIPGEYPQTATNRSHSNFDQIVEAATNGDSDVLELFDTGKAVAARFEQLTDRISVRNGTLYFDNDPVHNTLTAQVVRFLDEDEPDFWPLVLFLDNVKQNPNEHSVEQLYDWIEAQGQDSGLSINADGYIIGYKGVTASDGGYESNNSGTAIVDGETKTGRIPNNVGSVIEMPRSQVNHDPAEGCSRGLHVGTYGYAQGWASGALLKVAVNPRDVVSVPTDCSSQKMRVCRYVVLEAINAPVTTAYDRVAPESDYEYDDDYGDEDYELEYDERF